MFSHIIHSWMLVIESKKFVMIMVTKKLRLQSKCDKNRVLIGALTHNLQSIHKWCHILVWSQHLRYHGHHKQLIDNSKWLDMVWVIELVELNNDTLCIEHATGMTKILSGYSSWKGMLVFELRVYFRKYLLRGDINKACFKAIPNESKREISLGWYPINLDSRRDPLGS